MQLAEEELAAARAERDRLSETIQSVAAASGDASSLSADATILRARTLPRPDLRPGVRVALRVSDPVMAYAAD